MKVCILKTYQRCKDGTADGDENIDVLVFNVVVAHPAFGYTYEPTRLTIGAPQFSNLRRRLAVAL